MTDGFVRKKVESLTLGEKLRKLREQYRMSYAEIAKATRIQVKYLEYLESGQYEKLPAEVYVRGFLKSYARHLGLDEDAFLKLYDKEKHIRENLGREKVTPKPVRYPTLNAWVITPRTLLVALLVLILGGTFAYLFFEFRSFVAEPELQILDPLSGATIDGSIVLLKGKTDPGATVTANGEPVFIGSTGEFTEELALQGGLNRITVRATNRFNKTKEETIVIESRAIEAAEGVATAPHNMPIGFTFRVRAVTKAVSVTVVSGETVLYSGRLIPGKEESFSDLSSPVRLTTDDALHTEARLDEQVWAAVGQEAVPMSGKVYASETQTPKNTVAPTNP